MGTLCPLDAHTGPWLSGRVREWERVMVRAMTVTVMTVVAAADDGIG